MIEKTHCISPGNYELYRTEKDGEVVKVSACCAEGCNTYELADSKKIDWFEKLGTTKYLGCFDLKDIPHTGIQKVFKRTDNYTWCSCEKLGEDGCLFQYENINKDKGHKSENVQ